MADGKGHQYRIVSRVYRDGEQVSEDMSPTLGLAPVIETSESCEPGKAPVSQTEETVTRDGKTRKLIRVRICRRDIAAQVRSDQRAALSSLREARAELAQERALSEAARADVLANIDRSIARLEAEKKGK